MCNYEIKYWKNKNIIFEFLANFKIFLIFWHMKLKKFPNQLGIYPWCLSYLLLSYVNIYVA